ncbi:uncharacterized protein K452DRAFT_308044 [Aplosporella prunicola CBS 121167]|uniref:Uncharacterized protein n=1 Tax=Aplosporella prunicola CBS 121167 TaxID=1176127 RepID=A0A6A6BE51_9PEZI|nr:uncharacterized protein K452DRAFT_308044 [Aplosporella prunicola CBS 121167]KAF2142356.1 hypothetical protein K452DRAFT_308044 [Aplosporella prunicola CBS 121167]
MVANDPTDAYKTAFKTHLKILPDLAAKDLLPIEILDFDFLITKDRMTATRTSSTLRPSSAPGLSWTTTYEAQGHHVTQSSRGGFLRMVKAFQHRQPAALFMKQSWDLDIIVDALSAYTFTLYVIAVTRLKSAEYGTISLPTRSYEQLIYGAQG